MATRLRLGNLSQTRTALLLYAILVVLPTGVFGGLHWHQLKTSHDREFQVLPLEANNARDRFQESIQAEVRALLIDEASRPFYEYRREYWESISSEIQAVSSSLVFQEPPPGILAYYNYDRTLGEDAEIEYFAGRRSGEAWELEQEGYDSALSTFMAWDRRFVMGAALIADDSAALGIELRLPAMTIEEVSLESMALNLSIEEDQACLKSGLAHLRESAQLAQVEYELHEFQIFVLRDANGDRYIFAQRLVDFLPPDLPNAYIHPCFDSLENRTTLAQGFFLRPDFLHELLPRKVAATVLDPTSQNLVLGTKASLPPRFDEVKSEFDLTDDLPIRILESEDPDSLVMGVVVDGGRLRASFRRQSLWFLGVAGMMIISLAVGMGLLVHSVSASFERARRTENFVAAVTHELRTPIAAVKMYGEMLREGWVQSPEKQQDYLERIVRETDRLDGLVDRVLQKRRLGSGTPDPRPGDLSAEVETLIPDLVLTAGTFGEDLDFDLAEDLPPVLLLPEAVHAVVQNLVENARKYATPEAGAERIRVETRLAGKDVLLEVSDRGPGIPESERSRIFDAFYRIGDERTRTRPGTGLGLHIVQLQAQAMRARAQVLGREGGGTTFRVTFKRARV